jgi:hypothetical protein
MFMHHCSVGNIRICRISDVSASTMWPSVAACFLEEDFDPVTCKELRPTLNRSGVSGDSFFCVTGLGEGDA